MEDMIYKMRPYETFDYDFVYYIKKIVYRIYVEQNWGEWNEESQKTMFEDFIKTYSKEIKIIMLNNQNIGFFHGNDTESGDYEIGNICILPEFQGKGIGSQILKDIINSHKNQNIYLRFFKQNPVVNLYKRFGFEIVEELPHHYKMKLERK